MADVNSILAIPKRSRTWFDRLDAKQKKLANEVKERVQTDGLERQPIARNLVEALELPVSIQTVSNWLKQ